MKIIQKVKTSLWLSTLDTLVENVAKARMIEKQFLEGGMDALMAMAEAEMNGENGDQDSSSAIVNETSAVRVVNRKSLLTQRKNVSIQKRRRACIAYMESTVDFDFYYSSLFHTCFIVFFTVSSL